jgi:hypothetical protein
MYSCYKEATLQMLPLKGMQWNISVIGPATEKKQKMMFKTKNDFSGPK